MFRSVISVLITIASLPKGQTDVSCGTFGNCDYLVTVSIFEVGTCGRAARCNWELMHLKKHLLADTSNIATYVGNIHKALCNIPTYDQIDKDESSPIFETEDIDSYKDEYKKFPVTTQYYNDSDENNVFLVRERHRNLQPTSTYSFIISIKTHIKV